MIKKAFLAKLKEAPILSDKVVLGSFAIAFLIITIQLGYLLLRFGNLNPQIPFWYTRPWGDPQLASAQTLYIIPIISLLITILSFFIVNGLLKIKNKEGVLTTITFTQTALVFLLISEVRIISKASSFFSPLIPNNIRDLIPLTLLAFSLCVILVPLVIRFAKSYGLITDPSIHKHPGMILVKPSARAGGLAFYLAFILIALAFIPFTRETAGLFIGAFITTIIGLFDDKKNLSPYLRLIMLSATIALTLIVSDLHIYFFANPFDGITRLDAYKFPIEIFDLKFTFMPLADLFTTIWILWIMNMLSWSNAVDGQFSGMTAITCFIIAILSLRLLKIDPEQIFTAKLAAIAAGASLGILPYNWHPSKIMWGFGATTMGLVIAVLSIMAGTKVAAATFVLVVPTLDALITIIRRVLQKKSPVWGDRGHLHHRLLDMGFSQPQVALIYWVLTAVFGGLALISSGRAKFLALLTIGGIVAFILVAINLKGEIGKLKSPPPEK